MNELLPYEHEIIQKLETVPLPNEDAAWKNMRRRLDEKDDDDGILIPPVKGCGLYAVIGIVVLMIATLLFWNNLLTHQNADRNAKTEKQSVNKKIIIKNNIHKTVVTDSFAKNNDTISAHKKTLASTDSTKAFYQKLVSVAGKKNILLKKHEHSSIVYKEINNTYKNNVLKQNQNKLNEANKTSYDTSLSNHNYFKHPDSSFSININNLINHLTDTASKKNSTQAKTDSSENGKQKIKLQTQHKNLFSAGIGEYQQIPFGRQTFLPFKAEGLGGTILNYIPSVFFSFNIKQKFLLQLELRYKAPQLTAPDTVNFYTVKKIYYHQLPVSIHYNFTSHLSAGAGVILNRFSRVVAKQNFFMGDSTLSEYLKIKSDSSFKPVYFQGMFETEYKWNKFYLGVRYQQGLQRFLKDGTFNNYRLDHISSLQIFLRYELWHSKKK